MFDWPPRRESRREVTAKDAAHNSICEREYPQRVGHRLEPWRIDSSRMQYDICTQRENDDCQHARQNCAPAAEDVCRVSFTHGYFAATLLLFAAAASSNLPRSSFFISITAAITRSDVAGSLSSSNTLTGTTCHDRPYLSFNQPQTTSWPPSPLNFSQ